MFFEEWSESKERLSALFNEKKIQSPRSKKEYVNGSEFLLMMMMEFKSNRIINVSQKTYLSKEVLNANINEAVKPELER